MTEILYTPIGLSSDSEFGFEREEELAWRQAELRESSEDPFIFNGRHLKLVSFVSQSRGRNEKGDKVKRRPREVELLMVDDRYSLPIIRGEIRSRKNSETAIRPDELAQEILGAGATTSELYEMVRKRQYGY